MSPDHKASTDAAPMKPFSLVVTEQVRSGGVISKEVSDVIKTMEESDKSDVETFLLAGQLNAYDVRKDLRNAVSKAAKDQPVQVIFLSCKDPSSLMIADHTALFRRLDENGKYPLKVATTASVSLGELTDFEKKYGMGLHSISSIGMDVISRRLLSHDTATIRREPSSPAKDPEQAVETRKPQQQPRPLHEIFAEAEELQRSVTAELNRIEQAKSTEPEQPSSTQKKQPPPRVRLKRRRPS